MGKRKKERRQRALGDLAEKLDHLHSTWEKDQAHTTAVLGALIGVQLAAAHVVGVFGLVPSKD